MNSFYFTLKTGIDQSWPTLGGNKTYAPFYAITYNFCVSGASYHISRSNLTKPQWLARANLSEYAISDKVCVSITGLLAALQQITPSVTPDSAMSSESNS